MISTEIKEGRCNASRRSLFLQLLRKVNYSTIGLTDAHWADLLQCLRFVANQADKVESHDALSLFADIIKVRSYDTSRVMAILNPNDEANTDPEGNPIIDLAALNSNKEMDFFMLKFLLCNETTDNDKGKKPAVTM